MPRKPKIRAPYLMAGPPTWELARADYLGGMTAQKVADKHGIGLHNLRQTMARKGWTKRALAGAVDEIVMVQTLHARWSKLSEVELAVRADPTGEAGLADWVREMTEGAGTGKRRG